MSKTIEAVLKLRDEVTTNLKKVENSMDRFAGKQIKVGKSMQRTGRNMESLGKNVLALNAPLLAVGGASLKASMDFDKSMSQVQAITNASGKDMRMLTKEAQRIGETTSKSASDAAQAMIFLGQAGYNNNEIMKLSKPLVQLAIAGNVDMARASSLLADSLHAANIPMKDSQKYLDNVAKTANISNTSVSELMEAYATCGPSLRTANISMAESSSLLAILANSGIKGTEAGTSLSRVFMNLSGASGDAKKAMSALNIQVADSNGKLRSKVDVLRELKEKTDKLSEAERNQMIQMIGGKQYANDLKILLDGMGDSFDKNKSKIENSTGALRTMARVMADNLKGDLDNFKSKLEAVQIHIGKALTPSVREFLKHATELLGKLKDLSPQTIQFVGKVVALTSAFALGNVVIGGALRGIGGALINSAKLFKRLFQIVPKVGGAFKLLGGPIKFLTTGLLGLGPVGWAVAAVLLVVGVAVTTMIKKFGGVKKTFDIVKKSALEVIDNFIGIKSIKKIWNDLCKSVSEAGKEIKKAFKDLGGVFKDLWTTIQPIAKLIAQVFGVVLVVAIKSAIRVIATVVSTLAQVFSGIATVIQGFVKLIRSVFQGDLNGVLEGGKIIFRGFAKVIKSIWGGLKSLLSVPLRAIVDCVNIAFKKKIKDARELWNKLKSLLSRAITCTVKAITSAFHSALDKVKQKWNSLKEFLSHPIQGIVNMVTGGDVDGSHAVGYGRVPFDGYRAILHKDEMVLNKKDADKYREFGYSQNNNTRNTKIVIPKLADTIVMREHTDVEQVARELAKRIEMAV